MSSAPYPRQAPHAGQTNPRNHPAAGFSLTELLVSVAIIAMLASVGLVFNWSRVRPKIERTGCENNLKTLHAGFSAYLTDYGEWPQIPEGLNVDTGDGENAYWRFWITTMKHKDYGISEFHWLCPTDRRERAANQKPEEREEFESSYGVTEFDSGPNTPRAWPQPWFMERGDFHGDGPLICMPDGSIQPAPWGKF